MTKKQDVMFHLACKAPKIFTVPRMCGKTRFYLLREYTRMCYEAALFEYRLEDLLTFGRMSNAEMRAHIEELRKAVDSAGRVG